MISLLMVCMMLMTVQAPVSFASKKAAAEGVITAFQEPAKTARWFEGNPSEKELVAGLPKYLSVKMIPAKKTKSTKKTKSASKVRIPVTWKIVEDYSDTEYYFYSARPVLPKNCRLAKGLDPVMDVPWITLFRKTSSKEMKSGEQKTEIPVDEPKQLTPVYTESEGTKASSSKKAGSKKSSHGTSSGHQKKIYNYLTEKMDLNMAAACAVMTNLYAESGMQPNNLENTYNTRFGLSDSEYTHRVNKGKKHNGRYTTGYGSTRYFTKDYCGYGICQWTSLGRRKNLLKKAVKKDVSIGNLKMQLQFLKEELQNSYPQVWATLQGVPNNATGVYLAATHFCVAFEIPANTNATAASRAKTALSTYWKIYSGKSASVKGKSFLGLCGYSYPGSVKKGVGVTCSGHVISNYTIKKVSAKILNSKGRAVCSSTKRPGACVYSLYNFDRSMTFSKLSAGTYTYVIKARDSHGKSVKVKHTFKVKEGGKTITCRGCAVKNLTAPAPSSSHKLHKKL